MAVQTLSLRLTERFKLLWKRKKQRPIGGCLKAQLVPHESGRVVQKNLNRQSYRLNQIMILCYMHKALFFKDEIPPLQTSLRQLNGQVSVDGR